MSSPFTVTITRDGQPADLQPYLDAYAHLTAIHAGDLAFAHLHPHAGGPGRPLSFEAMLPSPGQWRLFLQFQTPGTLHTIAVTVRAS
jgi:hypothetical protein